VSFQLRNPDRHQSGKTPRIRATGNVSIPLTYMDKSDGSSADVLMTDTETKRALLASGAYLETEQPLKSVHNVSELTVEFWMQVSAATPPTAAGFAILEVGVDTSESLRVRATNTVVKLQVGGTEASAGITIPTAAGTRSSWYHYALSWRGLDDSVSYYRNGLPVTTTDTIAVASGLQNLAGILRLGETTETGEVSVAEVRLWSTARSAAAIRAQFLKFFQAGRLPASLVAYYTLASCSQTACKDDSVYGNDVVYGGSATAADNVLPMITPANTQVHGADRQPDERPRRRRQLHLGLLQPQHRHWSQRTHHRVRAQGLPDAYRDGHVVIFRHGVAAIRLRLL
jgi:hypothetical protein